MKTFLTNFFICSLIISFEESFAQSFTSKGTIELGGEVSFVSVKQLSPSNAGNSESALMVNPYLGVMVVEGFELGLVPGVTTVYSGSQSSTALNLFFAPAYNIKTSGIVYPYLEFLIGYNRISSYGGVGAGFSGGIKVQVGDKGLFVFNLRYLNQSYDSDFSSETLGTISAGIGFRVFFVSKSGKTK